VRRQEAIRILHDALPRLRAAYGVQDMAIFGSVARDEAGPDSDIDILVSLDRGVGLIKFSSLGSTLEELLGTKVDLLTWNSLNPRIRSCVEKDVIHVA
jgi:hypothetical protein